MGCLRTIFGVVVETAPSPARSDSAPAHRVHRKHTDSLGTLGTVTATADLTRPDGSPLRVLVVDDEVNIAELISMALRYEGWQVEAAHTGAKAVAAAKDLRPDAVVLDMMLPDFDGLEVLRRMRAHRPRRARAVPDRPRRRRGPGRRADRGRRRLRHQAVLAGGGRGPAARPDASRRRPAGSRRRRCSPSATSASTRTATRSCRDGAEISLTATEFELLRFLMRNPKRVLSKAQILDRVWNYDFGGQANVVELYISYLRKKIDAGREPMIHTMRGAGYVLKPAAGR